MGCMSRLLCVMTVQGELCALTSDVAPRYPFASPSVTSATILNPFEFISEHIWVVFLLDQKIW